MTRNTPRVLVHGNPETRSVWSRLLPELERQGIGDVICLSPPGFGAPVPADFVPTRENYVLWLADELTRIGRPVDLLGHDWGAGHVFGLAATRPDLLNSWAADCAGLVHPDYVWHEAAQVWQRPGEGEAFVAEFVALPARELVARFGVPEALADDMAAHMDAEMGRCILGLYRTAAQPAMRQLSDALAVAERRPALLIDATADPYVPPALTRGVAERVGAGMLTLDGQSHWWMWTDAARAAKGLAAFWHNL